MLHQLLPKTSYHVWIQIETRRSSVVHLSEPVSSVGSTSEVPASPEFSRNIKWSRKVSWVQHDIWRSASSLFYQGIFPVRSVFLSLTASLLLCLWKRLMWCSQWDALNALFSDSHICSLLLFSQFVLWGEGDGANIHAVDPVACGQTPLIGSMYSQSRQPSALALGSEISPPLLTAGITVNAGPKFHTMTTTMTLSLCRPSMQVKWDASYEFEFLYCISTHQGWTTNSIFIC